MMEAARAIQSFVEKGDISLLSPQERVFLYAHLCARYGLDPLLRPFDVLELKGKTTLYANRGATDAIAQRLGITRSITIKPHVVKLGGVDVVICEASATHNGRTETATATVALRDPTLDLMRCETKAKRRATLAVAGLGTVLDVSEVEGIPGASLPSVVPTAEEVQSALDAAVAACLSDPRITGPASLRDPRAWAHVLSEFSSASSLPLAVARDALTSAVREALSRHTLEPK